MTVIQWELAHRRTLMLKALIFSIYILRFILFKELLNVADEEKFTIISRHSSPRSESQGHRSRSTVNAKYLRNTSTYCGVL